MDYTDRELELISNLHLTKRIVDAQRTIIMVLASRLGGSVILSAAEVKHVEDTYKMQTSEMNEEMQFKLHLR